MEGRSMGEPQITTILPTYRRPKMLRRAIRSVLAQNYPHFKIMVLDNASGDETPEVVREMAREDCRIVYHCHDENIGMFANFQYGLKHVETPFFSFLSDDDMLFPHFYDVALAGFKKHPEAMFSGGITVQVDTAGRIARVPGALSLAEGLHEPPEGGVDIFPPRTLIWTAALFRREVVREVGFFAPDVIVAADLEFEMRIGLRFPYVFTRRPCAFILLHDEKYYPRDDSVEGYRKRTLSVIKVLSRCQGMMPEKADRVRAVLNRRLAPNLIRLALGLTRARRFDEAEEVVRVIGSDLLAKRAAAILRAIIRLARSLPTATRLASALIDAIRSLGRVPAPSREWEGRKEAEQFLKYLEEE